MVRQGYCGHSKDCQALPNHKRGHHTIGYRLGCSYSRSKHVRRRHVFDRETPGYRYSSSHSQGAQVFSVPEHHRLLLHFAWSICSSPEIQTLTGSIRRHERATLKFASSRHDQDFQPSRSRTTRRMGCTPFTQQWLGMKSNTG